jgi:GNAT superfamily N-acetyltransferase
MLIEIDPAEVKLEAESLDELFIVSATWRGLRAGVAKCLWDDAKKTRLLLADLEVEGERVVERRRFFRAERHASFRGLGIGKRLLRKVIEQGSSLRRAPQPRRALRR